MIRDGHGIRKFTLSVNRQFYYILLFLVMAGLCSCSGGGSNNSPGGPASPAAKVLASIVIEPVGNKLAVGKTQPFTARGIYADGTTISDLGPLVTWSSSNTDVATIAQDGVATALAAGETDITATAVLGNVSIRTKLIVPATTLASITITPSNPVIAINTTQPFAAQGAYSDGTFQDLTSTVIWHSSDASKAAITPDGKAAALAAGSATITATLGDVSAMTTLNVTPVSFQAIIVTASSTVVAAGTTQQFSATGTFPDNTTQDLTTQVTWSSSDSAIASIARDGKVTAVAPGSATITATLGSTTITTTLTVTAATLDAITVTPSNLVIAAGTKQQFSAIGTFSDSTTQDLTTQVTWISSASSIASIAQDGKATALAAGTTAIRATFGGISGTQNLSVTPALVTGTWEGTYTIYDGRDPSQFGIYTFKLVLDQNGSGVTGTSALRYDTIGQIRADGQFTEGNVTGRRMDFTFTYLKDLVEMVNVGTATISDTSMTGEVIENYKGGYNCSYIFSLKKL